MHIKIYFDTKPVFLCTELTPELTEILHHPDAVFIDEFSVNAIKSLLHEIIKPQFHAGVVLHTNLNELKKTFFKNFTQIEASGGIVENEKHQLLFIERLGVSAQFRKVIGKTTQFNATMHSGHTVSRM